MRHYENRNTDSSPDVSSLFDVLYIKYQNTQLKIMDILSHVHKILLPIKTDQSIHCIYIQIQSISFSKELYLKTRVQVKSGSRIKS